MKMPCCRYGDGVILPASVYDMYRSVEVGSVEPDSQGVQPVEGLLGREMKAVAVPCRYNSDFRGGRFEKLH